jgi:hypothetical protein
MPIAIGWVSPKPLVGELTIDPPTVASYERAGHAAGEAVASERALQLRVEVS